MVKRRDGETNNVVHMMPAPINYVMPGLVRLDSNYVMPGLDVVVSVEPLV